MSANRLIALLTALSATQTFAQVAQVTSPAPAAPSIVGSFVQQTEVNDKFDDTKSACLSSKVGGQWIEDKDDPENSYCAAMTENKVSITLKNGVYHVHIFAMSHDENFCDWDGTAAAGAFTRSADGTYTLAAVQSKEDAPTDVLNPEDYDPNVKQGKCTVNIGFKPGDPDPSKNKPDNVSVSYAHGTGIAPWNVSRNHNSTFFDSEYCDCGMNASLDLLSKAERKVPKTCQNVSETTNDANLRGILMQDPDHPDGYIIRDYHCDAHLSKKDLPAQLQGGECVSVHARITPLGAGKTYLAHIDPAESNVDQCPNKQDRHCPCAIRHGNDPRLADDWEKIIHPTAIQQTTHVAPVTATQTQPVISPQTAQPPAQVH